MPSHPHCALDTEDSHELFDEGRELVSRRALRRFPGRRRRPAKRTIGEEVIKFVLSLIAITCVFALPAAAGTDNEVSEAATVSASNQPTSASERPRCADPRRAVAFYSRRIAYWRAKMGASVIHRSSARMSGCPRHLAKALRAKAYGMRAQCERLAKKRQQELKQRAAQVIRTLNRGLAGSPMSGTGESLERWGRYYRVSPYFMAAVAATESSLGAAACSNNHYNVWGLSSCGSGWYVPSFRSWDEAIHFYARFLTSHWPRHSTPYSFQGYAACSSCWGAKTSEWMRRLFGVPAVTIYP